ncbi:MAG: type II toxin-antitoxin system Phd/YefM family antitoxin [Proteobacteria bacterium]|nr:type II toxin-antitoxin system Phd/YefM family antitoxin [Pseudomonadota bacterium]
MLNITPTELRKDIYQILDNILSTGMPIEIIRNGKILKIIAVDEINKLNNLVSRPSTIIGNADDLADVHWQDEVKLDLP